MDKFGVKFPLLIVKSPLVIHPVFAISVDKRDQLLEIFVLIVKIGHHSLQTVAVSHNLTRANHLQLGLSQNFRVVIKQAMRVPVPYHGVKLHEVTNALDFRFLFLFRRLLGCLLNIIRHQLLVYSFLNLYLVI